MVQQVCPRRVLQRYGLLRADVCAVSGLACMIQAKAADKAGTSVPRRALQKFVLISLCGP